MLRPKRGSTESASLGPGLKSRTGTDSMYNIDPTLASAFGDALGLKRFSDKSESRPL